MQFTPISYGIFLLVLVALVLGASTWVSHRQLSWKASLRQGLGSLLWASPVIAVLAFVAMRVMPHFQFGTINHHTANASPSWLEDDEGTADVEDVPAFPEVTTPVSLDLEKNPDQSLPAWTEHKVQRLIATRDNPEAEEWRIVLESDWEVSEAEAKARLSEQAARLVQEDFRRFHPGASALPEETVRTHAVRAEAVTSQVFNEDSNPFTMYKVYWQVELSPEVREHVADTWKSEIASRRVGVLGAVLALFTLIAGSFAAYFRLDERSQGAHRTRLKLATAALMTAGALGVLATLPTA